MFADAKPLPLQHYSVFAERCVVNFRVGTALCSRDLNFGLPGKKKDVDREARFLEGRVDGEVCGDLGALCHDRKGAFGRSYPIDDRIFRRNERRQGGGVEPWGKTASEGSRVLYPSLSGFPIHNTYYYDKKSDGETTVDN